MVPDLAFPFPAVVLDLAFRVLAFPSTGFPSAGKDILRATLSGKAKDVIDLEVARGLGKELFDNLTWLANGNGTKQQRDHVGGRLLNVCIQALEDAVRLTPTRRMTIARELYAEAKTAFEAAGATGSPDYARLPLIIALLNACS